MSPFARAFASQVAWAARVGSEGILWAFPATLAAGWVLWPALDQEWLIGMGMAKDPEADVKFVQAAKDARMAILKPAPATAMKSVEIEEEEAEEEASEEADEEEEEEAGEEGGDDEDDEEGGDDEDDEEDGGVEIKPLFLPTKGKKLGKEEIWDNFTIKAVRMSEDDDDDDEDDDDDDDDDEYKRHAG